MKRYFRETGKSENEACSTYQKLGDIKMSKQTVTLAADDVQTELPENAESQDLETPADMAAEAQDQQDAKEGIWRNRRTASPEHWDMYAKDANGDISLFLDVLIANPDRVKLALKKVNMSESLYNQLPDEAKALILKNGTAAKVAPTLVKELPKIGIRIPAAGGFSQMAVIGTQRFDLIRKMVLAMETLQDHLTESPTVKPETALQAMGTLKIRPNDDAKVGGFTLTYVKGDASQKARIIRELANSVLDTNVTTDETPES